MAAWRAGWRIRPACLSLAMKPQEPASPFEIDIGLRSLDELFNSLDPSPLVDRDIEDFIVDSVPEAPRGAQISLVLHLPIGHLSGLDPAALEQSITNYFSFLEARQTRQLRLFLKESRRDALVGLLFLIACIAGSQLVRALGPSMSTALISEGLIIIGWVANWRPVAAFLYDWRPMREKARIYARLSALRLQLREDVRKAPSPFPA